MNEYLDGLISGIVLVLVPILAERTLRERPQYGGDFAKAQAQRRANEMQPLTWSPRWPHRKDLFLEAGVLGEESEPYRPCPERPDASSAVGGS